MNRRRKAERRREALREEPGLGRKVWRVCPGVCVVPGAEGQAPKFGDLTLVLRGGPAPAASKI